MATTAFYSNKKELYPTYDGCDLGFTFTPESTTFKVWAPSAEQVLLKLYTTGSFHEAGAQVMGIKQMLLDGRTGVWSATVEGNLNKIYYTYVIKTEKGTHETQDVYSKAVGVNSLRSMVVDLSSTDPEGWENDRHVLPDKPNDAIVWEIHVRDFSSSDSSGVSKDHRGKFLAFTEKNTVIPFTSYPTCLNYLKELGITHVQLNPVFDFGSVNEITGVDYNWGYDPVNYNVPEGSYSTDPYHGEVRIREFKEMIKSLHEEGIGVIMDVVYNHTFVLEGSSLNLTTPNYYYRKSSAENYYNGSGLGNTLSSDKAMTSKFISDSLCHWVNEYHIDGFRFDLMGCHDYPNLAKWRANLDKIDQRVLMYGEPWAGGDAGISNGATKANIKNLTRVGAFNEGYSDALKGKHELNTSAQKGFLQGLKLFS